MWNSCSEKKKGECEECHLEDTLAFIVDPYLEKMYNDSMERWLCSHCYQRLEDE